MPAIIPTDAKPPDGLALHRTSQEHLPYYPAIYRGVTYDHAVVILRLDDGFLGTHSTLYPLLTARDLVAGNALVSSWFDSDAGVTYMTAAQGITEQSRGIEMLCHSATHTDPNVAANPRSNFLAETTGALATLQAKNLFIQNFIQPGTWTGGFNFDTTAKFDTEYGRTFKANFAAMHGYLTEATVANTKSLPFPRRYGISHQTADTASLATAQGWIDSAIRFGTAVEILAHSFNIGAGGFMTLADYTTLLTYIQTKRDAGLLDVLTPTGAAYAIKSPTKINLLYDGGFEAQATGTFVGWQAGGSPTVVVGRTGNGVQTNNANSVFQDIAAETLRSVRFEGWAKPVTGSSARIQLDWTPQGGGGSGSAAFATNLTTSAYTKVTCSFGNIPDATYCRLRVYAAASTAVDVIWDDVQLYKV